MTPREELDLILSLIRKYNLPLSPILEYAVNEKKEEYIEEDNIAPFIPDSKEYIAVESEVISEQVIDVAVEKLVQSELESLSSDKQEVLPLTTVLESRNGKTGTDYEDTYKSAAHNRKLFNNEMVSSCEENFAYTLKGDGIKGLKNKNIERVVIPEGVTKFCFNAFKDNISIRSVFMSDSIVYLGYQSWEGTFNGCVNLEEIKLSNSLRRIDMKSFYGCKSLKTVVIPPSVIKIEEEAFCGCSSLTSIDIPESVTQIGKGAFGDCM